MIKCIKELATKASSHEGQCILAGYCHAHTLIYVCGVNNDINSNHAKYLAQLCGRFCVFWKISAANLRILWRHLPTELRSVKHTQSSNRWRKQSPNPCIIGDAILPQTGKKLTKNAVRNLAVCCGAVWRHIEKRNIHVGAQLQSLTCIIAPKMFWKIYFLYDFWCAQTC